MPIMQLVDQTQDMLDNATEEREVIAVLGSIPLLSEGLYSVEDTSFPPDGTQGLLAYNVGKKDLSVLSGVTEAPAKTEAPALEIGQSYALVVKFKAWYITRTE